jgi:hypothetical protein
MENGQVKCIGTHQELLGSDEFYRGLASTQLLLSGSGPA